MSPEPVAYREFFYPLNVFMHVLTHEEGGVDYLHYGLFERPDESIAIAQQRSTALLLDRLPAPPARILEVGSGLATTLKHLTDLGYEAEGVTPDDKQLAVIRARYGDALPVHHGTFEAFGGSGSEDVQSSGASRLRYDVVLFQESSQYIDSEALFSTARALTRSVLVLDEFALRPIDAPGALHSLDRFTAAAARFGFEVTEQLDLSRQAAPTVDYFIARLPRYRSMLVEDLGITAQQVDDLVASGEQYRERYASGTYGYRLLALSAG